MIQLDTCIQKSCKCSTFYAAVLVNYLYVQCNKPFLKYQCRAIQFIFHTVMKYMYYNCHYNSIQDYLVSEQYAMTLLILPQLKNLASCLENCISGYQL